MLTRPLSILKKNTETSKVLQNSLMLENFFLSI